MTGSRRLTFVPVVCLGLIAAQLVAAGSASAAIRAWYVSPGGSGAACTKDAPCQLVGVMAEAGNGDVIVMEPGTYPGPGVSYTSKLTDGGGHVFTMTGEPGAATPVISSTAEFGGVDLAYGSTISHVQIDYTGDVQALQLDGSYGDHVTVVSAATSSGPGSAACDIGGGPAVLSDSLCLQTGPSADAFGMAPNGGAFSAVLRNDTAIATGAGGIALDVNEIGDGTMSVVTSNSIFKGGGHDVVAAGTASGAATVHIAHCAFKTTSTSTGGTITAGTGNIGAAPVFTNATHGDFREKASSPTVDAGAAAGVPAHDTDLAGDPRTIGSAPDIGAYELVEKPRLSRLTITSRTKHALHGHVVINSERLAATVRILTTHNGHKKTEAIAHKSGTDWNGAYRFTISGLKHATTYRITATAHGPGGTTTVSRHGTTKR